MRIVHLAAGAGGMYCGACARDLATVRGLIARGHDVELIPLYTPLRVEEGAPVEVAPVRMGGINLYLQQTSPWFRRLPAAWRRWLDSPAVLRFATKFAVSTEPAKLGEMTVSMLAGHDGRQREELARLIDHLAADTHPDLVVITNSLLSGIAPELKARLGVPVVCGLQGEDSFLAQMRPQHQEQAQALMRRNAASIDLFLAPHEDYAAQMAEFLAVPADRVRAVPTGLDARPYQSTQTRLQEPFTLGYLSVITPGKGLDLLVEALRLLVREEGREAYLHVAGQVLDQAYWKQINRALYAQGLAALVEYVGEVDLAGKVEFLHGLSAFSVPSRFPEARGVAVMEAQAAGVPVVVPARGAYPRMMTLTGGGLLVNPEDPAALAAALGRLMDDPAEADRLGRMGAEGVVREYSQDAVAAATLALYTELLERPAAASPPE